MNQHVAAFVRFWWVACLALAAGAIAGAAVIYEIHLGVPPTFEDRTPPSYTATTRLLVNNADNPIVRTGVPEASAGGADEEPPAVEPPGVDVLVDAANLLPLVIESDAVAALRRERVGPQRGTVTAQGLYTRPTDRPGLRPTATPVIEVEAVSPTPQEAVQLVRGTVRGFERWLVREQERADVGPAQRIVVQPLYDAPKVAVDSQNSYGLALLVVGAVLAGAALLITALHRTVPARSLKPGFGSAATLEPVRTAPSDVGERGGEINDHPREAAQTDGEGGGTPHDRLKAWLEEPASAGQAKEPPAKAKKAKSPGPRKAKAPRSSRS